MKTFSRTFHVRWADCDVNGHMRNTAYSEYAIDLRMAFLEHAGFPFERFSALGLGPMLLREEIDYVRELKLGDAMSVELRQLGLSPDGIRFRFEHDFTRADGKRAARIVIEGGWVDLRHRKLAAPPEELRHAFEALPKAEGWAELPSRRR
ncbi:MAG TPA: thioesterase family protein [Anaeromyxobacteraceae bacterium]|nr:thioesterase family protein [Anaeromyxobacteraceae bacterium]